MRHLFDRLLKNLFIRQVVERRWAGMPGDKATHKKWGVGMVVSVKGSGEEVELDIAFPNPVGVKRLLAKFAPIEKV